MAKRKTTNNKKNNENKNQNRKSNNKQSNKNIKNQKNNDKLQNNQKQNKKNEVQVEQTNEFSRLIKITLIVTAIFAVFYVITIVVTKKADAIKIDNEKKNETIEKAEIQYENIMIGTMLNQSGTYYVLIEEDEDNRSSEYSSMIENAKSNEDAPKIYKANLTDSFNKVYLGKEENYYVSDISEFVVKGTTLVKIVDGKIDSVYDNYDAIKNKLKELA